MSDTESFNFKNLYENFHSAMTEFNCGDKCAPYNEDNIPFCCDTRHAVPTAYQDEWVYLQANSNLWHEWKDKSLESQSLMQKEKPIDQVLIECNGHLLCQREFRSITCRAFPFFPYIDLQGQFLGLSVYWQYENRCWVISNLGKITTQYCTEFVKSFSTLFEYYPSEIDAFHYHSMMMRRVFGRQHRAIPLIHRNSGFYKISPSNGRLRRVSSDSFRKFFPFNLENQIPFPEEVA